MAKETPKKHILFKILCIIIIIIFIIYLYGRYINPYNLTVREIAIENPKLNKDYNGLKIAHFSDIHYGRTINEDELKKIVKNLNELKPDIVIFTGDLFDSKKLAQDNSKLLTKYLKKIDAKLYKFAIIGDYDTKYLDIYNDILKDSNFILLDNTSKLVYYKSSTPLNFIGITSLKEINNLYDNTYFNITLIHKPDEVTKLTNTPLVFAGHSLAGQIRIPFIGGIRKIDGAQKYYEDHYQLKDKELYISNGLGTQNYSFRTFNTPSITLYRLYNK